MLAVLFRRSFLRFQADLYKPADLYFGKQTVRRSIQPSVSTYRVVVTYEFARWLVNLLAPEVVQLLAG